MEEAKLQTVAQTKVFLQGTCGIAPKVLKVEEQYGFIERVLKRFSYSRLNFRHLALIRASL